MEDLDILEVMEDTDHMVEVMAEAMAVMATGK